MEVTKENFKSYLSEAISSSNDVKLFCNASPYFVAFEEMMTDLTQINENQALTPLEKLQAFQAYISEQQELLSFVNENYINVAKEVADPDSFGYPFLQDSDPSTSFNHDYPLEKFTKKLSNG